MAAKNRTATQEAPHMVERLPYALYESNGLLFELYHGGKAYLPPAITWVKVEPILADRGHVQLADGSPSNLEEGLWPTS